MIFNESCLFCINVYCIYMVLVSFRCIDTVGWAAASIHQSFSALMLSVCPQHTAALQPRLVLQQIRRTAPSPYHFRINSVESLH